MSEEEPESERQTELWREFEDTNGKGFWAIDKDRSPDEREGPSTIESVMDALTVPKITETRSSRHRAQRTKHRPRWLLGLLGGLVVACLGLVALASARTATPLREKPLSTTSQPTPTSIPTVTRWRTAEVQVPGPSKVKAGPTVTKTVIETPLPQVIISHVTLPPETVTKTPAPAPTVTKTVEIEVKVCLGYRPRTGEYLGEIECP